MAASNADSKDDRSLTVTRIFHAPLKLVWRMWAEEELRAQWWGPEGFRCLSLHQDFRPGGSWRAHISSAAEGELRASGVFRDIEPLRRLTFTFRWDQRPGEEAETIATVSFERRGGSTIQHFRQIPFQSVQSLNGHAEGWNSSFNRLSSLVEALEDNDHDNA